MKSLLIVLHYSNIVDLKIFIIYIIFIRLEYHNGFCTDDSKSNGDHQDLKLNLISNSILEDQDSLNLSSERDF